MSIQNYEISIPNQLEDHHLRIVKAIGKAPCEKAWETVRNYHFSRELIRSILKSGLNYGFTCTSGFACFIDADFKEIQDALDDFALTFRYSTGRIGHFQYLFFIEDEPLGENIPLTEGAYVKTKGGFVVGPGSVHPETGRIYGLEVRDAAVAVVKKAELLSVLQPFVKRKQPKPSKDSLQHERPNVESLRLEDLINLSGFRRYGSRFQGPHPVHGSETGVNFVVDVDKNLWHCFRCNSGGSALEWIAVSEKIIDCSNSVPGAIRGMTFWQVIAAAHDHYNLSFDRAAEILKRGGLKHD